MAVPAVSCYDGQLLFLIVTILTGCTPMPSFLAKRLTASSWVLSFYTKSLGTCRAFTWRLAQLACVGSTLLASPVVVGLPVEPLGEEFAVRGSRSFCGRCTGW